MAAKKKAETKRKTTVTEQVGKFELSRGHVERQTILTLPNETIALLTVQLVRGALNVVFNQNLPVPIQGLNATTGIATTATLELTGNEAVGGYIVKFL
jgi:hypothetical protein